jgi:hypothetical protein
VNGLGPAVSSLLIGLLAPPLSAQSIELGRWPATLHFVDGDSAHATFQVTLERDRLQIGVSSTNGNNWRLGNIRSDSTRLRFSWALDNPRPMECNLSRRSAVYWEGPCDDTVRGADGTFGRMLVTLQRDP